VVVTVEAGLPIEGLERLRIQSLDRRTLADQALVETQDALRVAVDDT